MENKDLYNANKTNEALKKLPEIKEKMNKLTPQQADIMGQFLHNILPDKFLAAEENKEKEKAL